MDKKIRIYDKNKYFICIICNNELLRSKKGADICCNCFYMVKDNDVRNELNELKIYLLNEIKHFYEFYGISKERLISEIYGISKTIYSIRIFFNI